MSTQPSFESATHALATINAAAEYLHDIDLDVAPTGTSTLVCEVAVSQRTLESAALRAGHISPACVLCTAVKPALPGS